MTHKTNPISYRLGVNQNWQSRYFSKKNLGFFLEEDELIRATINAKYKRAGIERVEIERQASALKIFIRTARPGFVIGKGGTGIEDLRRLLTAKIKKLRLIKKKEADLSLQLNIEEVKKPETSAQIVAENVAVSLEKRLPFRRVIKGALAKILSYKNVQGAKIKVAGRLGGADISRSEFVAEGKIPLITLRSNIDYAEEKAHTTYGVIGVKVWIYKGEILDKDLEVNRE